MIVLRSFISALFLYFFSLIPNWNEALENSFPQLVFFFGGFPNHLPNRRQMNLMCWRQTLLAWGTNAFSASDERFSAGDEHIENVC